MLTLIQCLFHTAAQKDPGHSAKSAGGRLHLNTLTMLSRSRHSTGSYQGKKLAHKSSGDARPQSSKLSEPLWADPGLKNKLIST